MMVADKTDHQRSLIKPDKYFLYNLWLPMMLFGSMGAITWAIRGTNGWGGIDGTLVPGLMWAILWYYLCQRRGVDARGVVLWLGMGLALGGELGYGQYVSWIQGRFYAGDEILSVSPWVGYAWFMLCGIGWAAPGGIILGWALHANVSTRAWLVRCVWALVLLMVLFNIPLPIIGIGVIDWFGERLIAWCSGLLFPNAHLGFYTGELDKHLARTVYTNTQNFAAVLWWLGAIGIALLQRDKDTLRCGAVIGGGFGIGFPLSAVWCLGYSHAPSFIDWWKMWELQAGFNLGVLYALVLFLTTRRLNTEEEQDHADAVSTRIGLFPAICGFLFIIAASIEYFPWTGLLLALFFLLTMSATIFVVPEKSLELRKRISLTYGVFLLVFMLVHGGTSRFGVVLGLYAPEAVNQYDWPAGRIALFLPAALLLFSVVAIRMMNHFRKDTKPQRLPERMVDLCAFTAFVGAISIWPDKIGILYALFLCLALFALTRLNRRFCE